MKKKPKKSPGKSIKKFFKWLFVAILVLLAFLLFSFSKLLTFLPDAPSLTGFPFGAKNYLVLAQNPAELRPTGGFVTAYVLLQFRGGELENMELHDVYGAIDDHPYVNPPYPLGDLLAHENYSGHSFRDANVYGDFPSSAQELIKFFNITKPQVPIDGVLAINFSLFEDVIGVLGEVEYEGQSLNKQNLFERLEHEINNVDRHNIEQIYSRKQFLQPVFYATLKDALKSPLSWRDLSSLVKKALNNKDIQIYMKDASLQRKYTKKGWTGEWPKPDADTDFFALVESNLGGMKSNRYITRQVEHNVYISPGLAPDNINDHTFDFTAESKVKISHHGSDYIPISGDYTSFVRVYAPPAARLTDADKDTLEYDESGYKVFAKEVALKPGQSLDLSFKYALPRSVLRDGLYRLYVPKQASTNDLYSLTVHAPRGMGIQSESMISNENVAFFKDVLDGDKIFKLEILPDKLSPLVIFQKMTALDAATIHFNEAIKLSDTNQARFQLIDLNFNDPQTDAPNIKGYVIDPENPRVLNLSFEGLTEQPEERYKLRVSGIEDIYGNRVNPDPTEITLIQRNLSY